VPIPPARSAVPAPFFTPTQELFRADGLTLPSGTSDTVTAGTRNQVNNSTSGQIDVSSISNGLLVVSVAGVSGTGPGLAVFFDVKDAFGNWCLVSNATAISGAVLNSTGTVYGNISSGYSLTQVGRIRWTVTGTGSPSFTGVSLSLYGR
jgi:hypothetical protein